MKSIVAKWGNSLAVRIPSEIARELGLTEGVTVAVTNDNGRVVVVAERRFVLKDMLREVKPSNLHAEVEFGKAKGREIW